MHLNNKKFIITTILVCLLISFYSLNKLAIASKGPFSTNVMAPLHINNYDAFEYELQVAKNIGVDAISVDVWWGDVEKQDNIFDWTYYDKVFYLIKKHKLKIVPIMSFHQCGGNVGDTYTSYLPEWVWKKYHGTPFNNLNLNYDDLKYKSELGNTSTEYLSLWVDDLVKNEYIDFMKNFQSHFSSFSNDFLELNISCGPAGELRYPSYNSHDLSNNYSGYPNKGYLQCYSNIAIQDFRNWVLKKYSSLENVNKAWKTNLKSSTEITPPMDGELFFYSQTIAYLTTSYGKDFINWYNSSLINHGKNMINYANVSFNDEFKKIPTGIKVPGVHWQINNTNYPRTAEICAGLINTDFSSANNYGYKPLMNMLKKYKENTILHFTCLEMSDMQEEVTSMPKTLVSWVGDAAYEAGIEIKGENALAAHSNLKIFWDNIKDAIYKHHYNGITILRINNAVYGDANYYLYDLITKVNSKKKNLTRIEVNDITSNPQERIYLIGTTNILGNWNIDKALPMYNYKPNKWSIVLDSLPLNTEIELKFIKKINEKVLWENNINNRKIILRNTGENYNFKWDN